MKIVFINPVGAIGGAERVLLTMLAALQATQPNLELHLIVGTDGILVEQAKNLGVSVRVLELPDGVNQLGDSALKSDRQVTAVLKLILQMTKIIPSIVNYLGELSRILSELKPDLIHSNGIKTHILTALTINRHIPLIWHVHDFYGARPLMARVLKLLSKRPKFAIAISKAVAADLQSTIPQLPTEVIYNAIDVNYFSPRQEETRRRGEGRRTRHRCGGGLRYPPIGSGSHQIADFDGGGGPLGLTAPDTGHGTQSAPRPRVPASPCHPVEGDDISSGSTKSLQVGLVATFARWKGHNIFLEAAAQIIRNYPELKVRFCIVGGAIYKTRGSQFSEQELRDRAAQLGIADKVDFLGFQQNIVEAYRSLDIVVHASTQPEPFGLAIVEAMACGKPVIISQAGGAAELFTHNYNAIGVPPGEPITLASAILDLLNNPEKRHIISENARHTTTQYFSQKRLGKQLFAVYSSVLDSK